MEAVLEFLHERADFAIDPKREKFMLTVSPRGFLKKIHSIPCARRTDFEINTAGAFRPKN
jgi:hypothetical protein